MQWEGNIPLISNKVVELDAINVVKKDNDRGAVIKSTISTLNDMISPMVYSDSIGIEGHMNIINNISISFRFVNFPPILHLKKEFWHYMHKWPHQMQEGNSKCYQ